MHFPPRKPPLHSPSESQSCSYDHLDLPTLQQIHDLRDENVQFLVPLGNKMWFDETWIPNTSQVTHRMKSRLPTQPGLDQKFVRTLANPRRCAHLFNLFLWDRDDGGSGLFSYSRKRSRGFMDVWTIYSGLAGSSNEHSPVQLRQTVVLSTLYGEPFHRHTSFVRIYLKTSPPSQRHRIHDDE